MRNDGFRVDITWAYCNCFTMKTASAHDLTFLNPQRSSSIWVSTIPLNSLDAIYMAVWIDPSLGWIDLSRLQEWRLNIEKVKVTRHTPWKAIWGRGGTAPLFLNLGNSRGFNTHKRSGKLKCPRSHTGYRAIRELSTSNAMWLVIRESSKKIKLKGSTAIIL
jgi:hypothetical protein